MLFSLLFDQFVYNVFLKGRMESEIGEANTHPPAGGSFSVGVRISSWVFYVNKV